VVDYVGRYTHRVAISNHRIVDIEGGEVKFTCAHIRCRRGAKLKMLCIILRPRERAREAALLPSTAGVGRRGNLVHRPDSPAVNRLKEQIRLLDSAPALV
jgi:hypothetical protein